MKKSIRLAIILNWYPPDRRVPARRWGHLVSNLCSMGVDCTVISAGDGKPNDYMGMHGERIIRLPISNHAMQTSLEGKAKKYSTRRILKMMLSLVVPPLLWNSFNKRWLVQFGSSKVLTKIARESDCIISSYGPLGPFILGWWLARKASKPWIADIRDSFASRDGKTSWLSKSLSRILEGRLLRKAEQRITIGKTLADYLSTTYGVKFEAVYNGWTDTDIVTVRNRNKRKEAYLYYAGSIYEHQIPALAIVFKVIQGTPNVKLKIRLLNDHTRGALTRLINSITVPGKIELLPAVDPKTVNEELADSIGALVVEAINNNDDVRKGTVTGKLISLLASGKPGIAVSSKIGEIRDLVSKVPGWHGVDKVEECQEALDKLLNHHSIDFDPQCLAEFHMSKQAESFLQLVRKAAR